MAKYKVYYGLGGGFGGAGDPEILDFDTEKEATDYAWEMAVEEYESYAGMHGIRDIDEIMAEEGVEEEEAYDVFCDERESWLDYWVEEVKDDE